MEPRIQYAKTEDDVSIAYATEGGIPDCPEPPGGPALPFQFDRPRLSRIGGNCYGFAVSVEGDAPLA